MKLLISLSYYSPHISGLTLSVKQLAELLGAHGYDVTVLTSQHEKELPLKERIKSVLVVRVPYLFRISKGFVMPSFVIKVYEALRRVDCVLITLPEAQGLLVAVLAKLLGKKVICLYICEVTFPGGIGAKIITSLIRLTNKATLFFADEIVTLTDDFAKHNAVLQNTGKKIYDIYPVVIPPEINKAEQNALQQKLPHKKYYIGYLGRIAAEKGIAYLLETTPFLQKMLGDTFVIVLAGPKKIVGEEKYQTYIEGLIKKYPEHVLQLGELADEQLGAFYSLLDVFVLPSTNNTEAFGMVQVEAMYCGTPVVATDLPGVRVPILKTNMGEIVPIQNFSALAEAIVSVLRNKKKYVKEPGAIQEIFSTDKILKAYQEVFKF